MNLLLFFLLPVLILLFLCKYTPLKPSSFVQWLQKYNSLKISRWLSYVSGINAKLFITKADNTKTLKYKKNVKPLRIHGAHDVNEKTTSQCHRHNSSKKLNGLFIHFLVWSKLSLVGGSRNWRRATFKPGVRHKVSFLQLKSVQAKSVLSNKNILNYVFQNIFWSLLKHMSVKHIVQVLNK